MKKVLLAVLKGLGYFFCFVVILFISLSTESAVIGIPILVIGVLFLIWLYIRNKKRRKIKAENASTTSDKKNKEKSNTISQKQIISEIEKPNKNTQTKLEIISEKKIKKPVVQNTESSVQTKFHLSDIFKSKQFKNKIVQLQSEYDELEKQERQLQRDNQKLKKEADFKLSIQQMKPVELDKLIKQKESQLKNQKLELFELQKRKNNELEGIEQQQKQNKEELDRQNKAAKAELNYQISQQNKEFNKKKEEIIELKSKIKELKDNMVDLSEQAMYEDYGLYKPRYDFANSSTYKGKLSEVRANQKLMIKEGTAGEIIHPMLLDDSVAKGRSMQKKNIKQLLRSFNGECEAAINKVTKSNIETIEKRINRSFEQLNKLNESNAVRLTTEYLDSKLDEAHIALEYALKKEQEKELLREQRQREKEERQAQKEFAREQTKYEKDETHFEQAKELLEDKIKNSKSTVEVESLKLKLDELQKQLDDIKDKKAKLIDRAETPSAGYVYIISNIGSFGQNVYKIGVTRRLDPMDRINELSSASVPFKFDVHALIFTNDAYKLETELHDYFDRKRVNKVNKRKEFFRLNIDDIKKVLSKHKELTFDFQEIPDAPEYRDSLLIEQEMKTEQRVN